MHNANGGRDRRGVTHSHIAPRTVEVAKAVSVDHGWKKQTSFIHIEKGVTGKRDERGNTVNSSQ